MKRLTLLVLVMCVAAAAQIGSGFKGRGGVSTSMLEAVNLWEASGATRITPKDSKAVYAESLIVKYNVVTYDSVKNSLRVGGLGGTSTPLTVVGNKTSGNLIYSYNDKDATIDSQLVVTAKAYIGVGTSTPLNRVSLVDKTSGQGTGIHVVSSQWNKARSTWAAAHDTSSIMQYIDSAGGPRLSMKAVDGDSLGITLDGADTILRSSANITFDPKSAGRLMAGGTGGFYWTAAAIYGTADDSRAIGTSTYRIQEGNFSDNLRLGGKSQTATMTISGENVIAGQDSSLVLSAASGTPTITAYFGAPSFTNGGRRFYAGADTLLLVNGAKTGRDSTFWVMPTGGTRTTGMYGNNSEQAVTVTASATTFAVLKNNVAVTGDAGGNTIATITGGGAVGLYTFRFIDDKITITDTDAGTANTVNLSAAFTSTANDIMTLYWNGTSWYEASRSIN